MPMIRYAYAAVQPSRLYEGGWDRVRVAAKQSRMDRNLVTQASEILNEDFDPKKYLLTHCTIVASVDTYAPKGSKVGAATVDGKSVVRKTAAYRIKPECDQFINNNIDSWARPVLLKSFETFRGGHNFLEHVQKEELSKGRLLDAVARDIGPSIYIDLLVATSRKHTELVSSIEAGELTTLSMGCSIDGSTCTKCGHWAADETEMCEHVRYEKGNVFYDDEGVRHRVAELCGDESLEPTGGVQFIEASWVKVPAFRGATMRNVIEIATAAQSDKVARRLGEVLTAPAPFYSIGRSVAASVRTASEDPFGGGAEPSAEEPAAPESNSKDLDALEEEIRGHIMERVRKKLKDQISQSDLKESILPSDAPNDGIVKQAARTYRAALGDVVSTARTGSELMGRVARINARAGVSVPGNLYRVALQVGATSHHDDLEAYLAACRVSLGRSPTGTEARTLIRLSALLTAFHRSVARRK